MVFIKLPWRERKLISDVAKLYCDIALNGEGFDDRINQFWRISMYVKVGLLSDEDARTICTAMESFYEFNLDRQAFKDPDGSFRNLGEVIPKLRALLEKKQVQSG